tara:strand:- start:5495 stop:5653 length:159 start_codon:yes stop_codon:yes gene_type:complete
MFNDKEVSFIPKNKNISFNNFICGMAARSGSYQPLIGNSRFPSMFFRRRGTP